MVEPHKRKVEEQAGSKAKKAKTEKVPTRASPRLAENAKKVEDIAKKAEALTKKKPAITKKEENKESKNRGRGRPRKSTTTTTTPAASTALATKNGRGRPKGSTTTIKNASTTIKKGRGRPMKAAPKLIEHSDEEDNESEEDEEDEEEESVAQATSKKGDNTEMEIEENEEAKKRKAQKYIEEPKSKKQKKEVEHKKQAEFRITVPFSTLLSDVMTMGSGEVGQLGLPNIPGLKRPALVVALQQKNILKLEVGGMHNMVLVQNDASNPTDTTLWSWGCNDNKVLGRVTPPAEDEDDISERPEIVPALEGKHIIDICTDSVALAADGTLYLWGSYKEQEGFLGYTKEQKKEQDLPIVYPPTAELKFKQISSGHNHTLAVTHDGRVLVWGYQVQWSDKSKHLIPREIDIPSKVKRVFSGGYTNFVITEDDKVYAWGLNGYGQLGIGSHESKNEAVEVKELSGKQVISIAPGIHHTIALCNNGKVYSFGRGSYGQLGTGETDEVIAQVGTSNKVTVYAELSPVEIQFFSQLMGDKVKQIAGVDNHNVAVTKEGKLYTWGFGDNGQLGNATREDDGQESLVPFLVKGKLIEGKRIIAAGAGGQHTALLAASG